MQEANFSAVEVAGARGQMWWLIYDSISTVSVVRGIKSPVSLRMWLELQISKFRTNVKILHLRSDFYRFDAQGVVLGGLVFLRNFTGVVLCFFLYPLSRISNYEP